MRTRLSSLLRSQRSFLNNKYLECNCDCHVRRGLTNRLAAVFQGYPCRPPRSLPRPFFLAGCVTLQGLEPVRLAWRTDGVEDIVGGSFGTGRTD